MGLVWLSAWHGLVLGLATLLGVGWCLAHFWRAHVNWPIVTPSCGGNFRQRAVLLALLAWATVISGAYLAWQKPCLVGDLWPWKVASGSVGTLALSLVALTALRAGQERFAQRVWRRRWLLGLVIAQVGFLLAALLGALMHYLA